MWQDPKTPKNQHELMLEDSKDLERPKTEIVKIPGIENLHNKSYEDVVEAFVMVFKSRSNVESLKYVVGEHFEFTYKK